MVILLKMDSVPLDLSSVEMTHSVWCRADSVMDMLTARMDLTKPWRHAVSILHSVGLQPCPGSLSLPIGYITGGWYHALMENAPEWNPGASRPNRTQCGEFPYQASLWGLWTRPIDDPFLVPDLGHLPLVCTCSMGSHLSCRDAGLQSIPAPISSLVTFLWVTSIHLLVSDDWALSSASV